MNLTSRVAQLYNCTIYCTVIIMQTISYSEARSQLKAVLDSVANDKDATIITRRDAEDAVVMSLDYYNSLMETVHLLKSPANARHLSQSIEEYRQGNTQNHPLSETD